MSRTLWRMKVCVATLGVALTAVAWGADWPTDGGNPQRTNWQQDETILTKQNVGESQNPVEGEAGQCAQADALPASGADRRSGPDAGRP